MNRATPKLQLSLEIKGNPILFELFVYTQIHPKIDLLYFLTSNVYAIRYAMIVIQINLPEI